MKKRAPSFSRPLLGWYDRHRRDLPWRVPKNSTPNPYHVLVSELMLQQTQVATVIPYFNRFIERFPTLPDLASADLQEILRFWQGLGYYSRARNLHALAQTVLSTFAGQLPSDPDALLQLPGVGRYTAGAIASIGFDRPAPILDGNVIRVLCRLDKIQSDPRDRTTLDRLWNRARQILPRKRSGDFNSALMELGATVCTPRSPQCLLCPVQSFCKAFAAGLQERIPAPRPAKSSPLIHRHTYCFRRNNRWLIEQRPPTGRWPGLWQFITIDPDQPPPHLPTPIDCDKPLATIRHALSHRRYEFSVFLCDAPPNLKPPADRNHAWVQLSSLPAYPLSRPQLKIAALLQAI